MARIAVMFLLVTPGTKTLINEAKIGLLALKQFWEIINCVSYAVLSIEKLIVSTIEKKDWIMIYIFCNVVW